MRQTTRRKTHFVGLLLALAVFAGGLVPPGRSQQKSQDTAKQQSPKQGDGADPSVVPPEPLGKIAFASDRAGNFDIYVMNPDGTGLVRITDDPAEDTHPTWSPDGRQIAFVSTRDGNKEIYVVSAEGGAATRLTNNAAEDFSPAWSLSVTTPRIAFVSHRDGNDEVYLMNTDGTGQTNITNNAADDNDPAWLLTAAGTLISFASNRDGDKFEIYRQNINGTGIQRVTTNSFNDVHPAWPAGRFYFQSDRDGNDEIYLTNADGSNPIRITDNAAFDLDPTTASDGSRLVWVSNRDGADNLEIYAANPNGSVVTRLTNNPASDIDPAVQPFPSAATLGSFQLSAATYTVGEGQLTLEITVTRTGGTGAASVEISTVPVTASERTDYSTLTRRLYFAAGEASRTVRLSVIDDLRVEGDETLSVTLSDPFNSTLGAPATATVTITDNDTTPSSANPIDIPETFVRQHYLDFLGREPDPAGFQAWVNVLKNCPNQFNNDPNSPSVACDRVTVSSSFFRSPEFELRGAFAVRSYIAAFGRLPTFREFLRDLMALGGDTDAEVLANRARFPDDFTQRPEFGAIYDALSNEAYVDRLIANTGASIPAATRNQLVADLNSGAKTRAQVFREIVDNQAFVAAAFNRVFVLMQYFGYLRRDPESTGFNAWLNYLNANPNDFRTMVFGFVNSQEYRSRFGPP
ncbi:MAG TPA: Calx-beta domain-containing protein [Pyrinomonadaceae bacterium]|nr:Calx-beta domain-containing protein [Pyrinomonadaceae bacterium]